MYMAVAYYRLGRTDRALEELDRASELDPKDPFPHMLRSIVHSDAFSPTSAIAAGRTARDLLPYLKSLNQVANNQKGTANLGNAFAFFGLEEWANSLAQESYFPYWAGSHLFLGDRYPGLFNKNSEYFQGVIVDPTVFGGATRHQTLLPKPGHHLSTGVRFSQERARTGTRPFFTANGFNNAVVPTAYFVDFERTGFETADSGFRLGQHGVTAAVGTTPSAEWGLFAFGNFKELDGRLSEAEPLRSIVKKLDLGLHYRLRPTSVVWAKVGGGRDRARLADRTDSEEHRHFQNRVDTHDWQVRHTVTVGDGHEVSWGVEAGDRDERFELAFIDPVNPGLRVVQQFDVRDESRLGYVSDRMRLGARLLVQGDLFVQRYRRRAITGLDVSAFELPFEVADIVDVSRTQRVEPRLGAAMRLAPGRVMRVAYQRWGRPASVSTLGPVATAGIALDDQLVRVGGTASRYRGQVEWEWTPRTFSLVFVDQRQVDNPALGSGFRLAANLHDLLRLRVGTLRNTASADLLEGSPEYGAGQARTVGAAVNRILSPSWSVYARYFFTESENTDTEFRGNVIPFVPRHLFSAGASWVSPWRVYASGQVVRRSARFADEANADRWPSEWRGTVRAYWEVPSKRWAVAGIVDNLLSPAADTAYGIEVEFRH
jgi:hypothetical protein